MDGFTACQNIRTFSPVPIIMLTARGRDEDKVRGLDMGADDYLLKPFDNERLHGSIKRARERIAEKRYALSAAAVEAARSVLLELTHLLGEYQDGIVVVGGWVPQLLLSQAGKQHVGSLDVDVALDHQLLQEAGYKTIMQLLRLRGYRQGEQPYIFYRSVHAGGRGIEVEVDFLAGEYAGSTSRHRTQKVQDMQPRKARGCDLAIELATEVSLSGTLPDGGRDSAIIRVASIVPFLVMKAMALAGRLREKDAWDIYFCVRNFPGGLDQLVEEFRPHLGHSLVQEALTKMGEKFASPDHIGPKHVADFEDPANLQERAFLQRDAFERVHALIGGLKGK